MARKAISPTAYIEAWKSLNYDAIHEAALAEASRQVNEMVKWMNWQIKHDPDEMKEFHTKDGIFVLIKKARSYRETMIYNRNKYIAEIEFERIAAAHAGDRERLDALNEQIAQWNDDQHGACRRIMKIYCAVRIKAGGSFVLNDPEDIEYEYDPE